MATLLELSQFFDDADLLNKVRSATVIAANNLLDGTPTADEKRFAANVFQNSLAMAKLVVMAVIAENNGASVAQIQNATDTAIQNQVNKVIPNLIGV